MIWPRCASTGTWSRSSRACSQHSASPRRWRAVARYRARLLWRARSPTTLHRADRAVSMTYKPPPPAPATASLLGRASAARQALDASRTGARGGRAGDRATMCVYSVRIARINIYLPDELANQARAAQLNVSALAQEALRTELVRHQTDRWLERVRGLPRHDIDHASVIEALDAAREELGGER